MTHGSIKASPPETVNPPKPTPAEKSRWKWSNEAAMYVDSGLKGRQRLMELLTGMTATKGQPSHEQTTVISLPYEVPINTDPKQGLELKLDSRGNPMIDHLGNPIDFHNTLARNLDEELEYLEGILKKMESDHPNLHSQPMVLDDDHVMSVPVVDDTPEVTAGQNLDDPPGVPV
jgi:hypothetical protein